MQLSPKALRIYDEQRLLAPARIDALTGYRYYAADQVPLGRLIRTLREMDLPLAAIANVLASRGAGAEGVLAELAREQEERYARERRAYHAALLLLHDAPRGEMPQIVERMRPATTVIVRPFAAARFDFVERFRAEDALVRDLARQAGLSCRPQTYCSLVDPLSDDEGRLEVVAPIDAPHRIPEDVTLRQLPAAACAVIALHARRTHASDLAGALDALFDWFDRRGRRAIEPPLVTIGADGADLRTEIHWAYESTA